METSTGFTIFTPKGPSISKVLYGPIMSYQFYPDSESDRFYTWEATGFACSLKMHRKASRQVGLWSGHVGKVSGPKILKNIEKQKMFQDASSDPGSFSTWDPSNPWHMA